MAKPSTGGPGSTPAATVTAPETAVQDALRALDAHRVHPAAAMWPLLEAPELAALAEDIRRHGQQEPVWTYRGEVLDGRNRIVACHLAGVTPLLQEWQPRPGETPTTFVLSRNLHRRHLSASQRATVAVRIEGFVAEENRRLREEFRAHPGAGATFSHPTPPGPEVGLVKTPGAQLRFTPTPSGQAEQAQRTDSPFGVPAPPGRPPGSGRARDQAAAALKVSGGYVNDAKNLARADPATFELVARGELTLLQAQELVVRQARDADQLEQVRLRRGAVERALARLTAREARTAAAPTPRIRLRRSGRVTSSRTTVRVTVTFGNPKVAEERLNAFQDDPKVLDMSVEVLDPAPARTGRRTPRG